MTIHARYTEVLYNLLNNTDARQAIETAMSTYPIYVSTSQHEYGIPNVIPTRAELNAAILNYYKYREIGFETFGRFLDELETSLKEIMPYYNQLFYSADQDFNIIYNVDYVKTIEREKTGSDHSEGEGSSTTTGNATDNTSTTGSVTNTGKNVRSDTPQNELSISNIQIDTVSYASEAAWNKEASNSTGSSQGTSTSRGTGSTSDSRDSTNQEEEGITETTKGNFGVVSAQDLILKYRETVINITQQIINDPRITELFMLVY